MLRQFLSDNGLTQAAAAEALGVSNPAIHCWLIGRWQPSALNRQAIEVWTGGAVPASSWRGGKQHTVKPFVPSEKGAA